MRTDLIFYEPHEQARKRGFKPPMPVATIAMQQDGEFHLNRVAADMLDLKAGSRVMLGNSRADAREWFLVKAPAGRGFVLRAFCSGRLLFSSTDLRNLVLATLPHAPQVGAIRFKIDPLTLLEDYGEVFPLLTAQYYRPMAATADETAALPNYLLDAAPGLSGIVLQADLPE